MELERADLHSRALLAGTPEQLQPILLGLAKHHGVDEVIVNTLTHDPADRLRSYRLLSEAVCSVNA